MRYHLRRKDREITHPDALREVIRSGRYAVIALCRDSEPYVVTLSYGFDPTGDTFYFHGAETGQKVDFLSANPEACLTVIQDLGYQDNHCTQAYRSVVVRGKMIMVEDPEERLKSIRCMIDHLETNPAKFLDMVADPASLWPKTRMFKLRIESITGKERLPVS